MITAQKSPFIERILLRYFLRRIRTQFACVRVKGMAAVEAPRAGVPLVLYANHPGWWDGVIPFVLSAGVFRHDAYAMMEEPQMRRYGFFRRIGCFSVERGNGRSALRSLEYATELLRARDRVLWIFPQGELTPVEARPVQVASGTARLLRALGDVVALPVAIRYDFIEAERPEVCVSFGEPWRISETERVDVPLTTAMLARLLEHEMDMQREDVITREFHAYRTVVTGRRSVNERWDAFRSRILPRSSADRTY